MLETAINEAGIYAGFDNRDKIEKKDIVKACLRTIFGAPETVEPVDDKFLRNIAVHEAGHAVVSEVLDPGSVSLVSVCRYSGDTEGVTIVRKPEGYQISKTVQEREVMTKLGGKAATELILGNVDVGCDSDLSYAMDRVERFVDNYCSYGFDTYERHNPSGKLMENKERKIATEMER